MVVIQNRPSLMGMRLRPYGGIAPFRAIALLQKTTRPRRGLLTIKNNPKAQPNPSTSKASSSANAEPHGNYASEQPNTRT